LFCNFQALADTFGLGTAGPGNWGVLETGTGTVTMNGGGTNNPSGISVNSGASASQANLGINSGGRLSATNPTIIQGTYYKFSTNTGDSISGTTIVGGTNTTSDGKITQAVSDAQTASANLANPALNPPNQTFGTISATTTITATNPGGRTVVNVGAISLGNGLTLTLSGPATSSFVINVSSGITLGAAAILLTGGLTPDNVIFNVTGGNVSVTGTSPVAGTGVLNGIVMDLNGTVTISGSNDRVNGEIIAGQSILLTNGSDVEAVPTPVVPEPSTAAYFTLGPLSLLAVMLLHRRFSRRKQAVVGGSHDPPESVLEVVKSG
jgi:hypothetical protein